MYGTPPSVYYGVVPDATSVRKAPTLPRDDDHFREAVDRAREEYHDAIQRMDQTPNSGSGRDTALVTVLDAMKQYQTAMDARIASLAQR